MISANIDPTSAVISTRCYNGEVGVEKPGFRLYHWAMASPPKAVASVPASAIRTSSIRAPGISRRKPDVRGTVRRDLFQRTEQGSLLCTLDPRASASQGNRPAQYFTCRASTGYAAGRAGPRTRRTLSSPAERYPLACGDDALANAGDTPEGHAYRGAALGISLSRRLAGFETSVRSRTKGWR